MVILDDDNDDDDDDDGKQSNTRRMPVESKSDRKRNNRIRINLSNQFISQMRK